jgi:hypothetical protein
MLVGHRTGVDVHAALGVNLGISVDLSIQV